MQVIHSYEAFHRSRLRMSESRPKVSLIAKRGIHKSQVCKIESPLFVIGNASDCDLILGDDQFCDYHSYILLRDGQVTLRHLGKAPMVTVNGRWIRWGELRHGDRIRTGPYEFMLRVVPAVPGENHYESENRNAAGNMPVFEGLSSTATTTNPDDSTGPVDWSREATRLGPAIRWPTDFVPGRLLDWW